MLNLTRTEKIQMGQVKGKRSEFLPVPDLRALHISFIRQVKEMMDCTNENLVSYSNILLEANTFNAQQVQPRA